MGSPKITKSVPKSPAVQDSPIFSYVSSLSPIKPVNVRPGVQAYENIDLPSPQPVFKTPHFSRPRNSNLLERSQHPVLSGAENLSPGYANNITEFSENENITGPSVSLPMAQFISCTEKECAGDGPSPDEPCISPSSCVDVFLADPLENGDNLSSSPDFYAKRTAKGLQGDSTSTGENQIKCCKEDLAPTHPRTSAVSVRKLIDDCVEHSTCLYSKQDTGLPHTSENDPTSTEETTAELHVPNVKKCTSSKAVVSLSAPYQTEEDPGNVSMADETMEINERSGNEQLVQEPKKVSINTDSFIVPASSTRHEHNSVNQCATDHPPVSTTRDRDTVGHEKESSTTSGFLCHGAKDVKLRTAKTGESDELDCTPQLHPGSPQNIQAGDNQINNSGQMSTISTENQIPYDQEEAAQYQRGKRKRLQFEAAESLRMSIGCNRNSYNYATEASDVELSITPFEMETVNASHAESITTSGNKHLIQSVPGNVLCRLSFKVDRSGQYKGSSPVTAPRPSGIGLHLNSIGSVGSMNCNINMQLPEKDAIVQEEKSFAEENDQVSQESANCLASMSLIGHSVKLISSSRNLFPYAGVENNEEKKQGNQAINVPNSSVNYQSPLCVKPLNSSLPLKLIDRYMTPCTMKMPPSEEASKSEESTQTSPRKKRKKASENEGHKRCNCKRSKCLKLYCDCFASGSFCSEACACQECFNKPDYEDTVLETRQQIESRNPLAFAPKVVLRITDPPKDSGDSKRITPTSARHKSGCNCKKSQCLKKYCECYQAGVGCSLGCRCEGCKNTFGRKDGCGEISEIVVEHKKPKEGGWERDLSGEMEGIEVKRELVNTKQCHSRLSPLTPSVQTSVGNDVPKPQFPASYYPSPESGASVLPSYEESPSAAMDSIQNGAFAEEIEGFSALVPYDPDFEYHNAGKVDTFSPGWDGFPDICNLSPLLKTSPSAAGSSSVSKTRDRNVLQAKLFQKSGRISLSPLCWRSSPVTPLPQFAESKFVREPYSDSGQHCIPEDDTPEILKDTRSPIQAVKATSPNQKRVSPPHEVIHEARSNTPSGLRNSRKFILQSVPAFPPLTPYSNNTGEDGT